MNLIQATESVTTPRWLPASRVPKNFLSYVAWFEHDFDALVKYYHARTTLDRVGGGAGPVRTFFVELSHRRIAGLSCREQSPAIVELNLVVREGGRVDWEDYEQIMAPHGIPLERVHRQGGLVWRRRKAK